jgi:hypothetical protein
VNRRCAVLAIALLSGVTPMPCRANLWDLSDNGSYLSVNDDDFHGALGWTLSGAPEYNLGQMALWYRVGPSDNEDAFGDLAGGSDLLLTGSSQPASNTVIANYAATNPQPYAATATYLLTGQYDGIGTSKLQIDVSVFNTGSEVLDFHLFLFNSFALNRFPTNDTAVVLSATNATQYDTAMVLMTMASLPASHYEVGELFFSKMSNPAPDDLNDYAGPLLYPPDFAFQWDMSIPAGESWSVGITHTLAVIPEPATMGLLGLGALGVWLVRHRRRGNTIG